LHDVKKKFNRTRIAPTPSGFLHLGNVFSFSLTAGLAKRSEARIFLRIDDLDRSRVRREYVDDIFDTLNFLQIPWDEGPRNYREYEKEYSQEHRLALYDDALQRLRRDGRVFACDCSRALLLNRHPAGFYTGYCKHRGLPLDVPGYAWRLDTTGSALPPGMQYMVVRKRDGFPAYQLASLLDDVYYDVDLIVRGDDLYESTRAQHYLAQILGYESFLSAEVYHHPLLKADDKEKLSKSAGATSIQYLRKQGASPEEIYRKVGQMAGLQVPVDNWKQLTDAFIKN